MELYVWCKNGLLLGVICKLAFTPVKIPLKPPQLQTEATIRDGICAIEQVSQGPIKNARCPNGAPDYLYGAPTVPHRLTTRSVTFYTVPHGARCPEQ